MQLKSSFFPVVGIVLGLAGTADSSSYRFQPPGQPGTPVKTSDVKPDKTSDVKPDARSEINDNAKVNVGTGYVIGLPPKGQASKRDADHPGGFALHGGGGGGTAVAAGPSYHFSPPGSTPPGCPPPSSGIRRKG